MAHFRVKIEYTIFEISAAYEGLSEKWSMYHFGAKLEYNEEFILNSSSLFTKIPILIFLIMLSKNVNPSPIFTHRVPLAETGLGFQLVTEAKDSIKAIIEPHR